MTQAELAERVGVSRQTVIAIEQGRYSPFTRQRLRMLLSLEKQADLETLAGLAEEGKVTPAVERTFPLAQAADAIRHLEQGRARGKVVVTI